MADFVGERTTFRKRIIDVGYMDYEAFIDVRRYFLHPTKGWKLAGFDRRRVPMRDWRRAKDATVTTVRQGRGGRLQVRP